MLKRSRFCRAVTIRCLALLQCQLLWVAMLHQHPVAAFAESTPAAVSQGSSPTSPVVAGELTCTVCQMVRHSLALPVGGLPALPAAAAVSRLLLFLPAHYHSYSSTVVLGRAPPLA